MNIYSYPNNPRVFKALIASKYYGITINCPEFTMGVDNKTTDFLKHKNLTGKVPVLETSDGCIFESQAILRYIGRLGNGRLYGNNLFEMALIDQWLDFATNEIQFAASAWLIPVYGFAPYNPQVTKKAKLDVKSSLKILNTHLATRTFMVGERITLSDIALTMNLLYCYKYLFSPSYRKDIKHVNRWFLTCINQPEFKEVIGEVSLCLVEKLPPKTNEKQIKPPEIKLPPQDNHSNHRNRNQPAFAMDECKRKFSNTKTRDGMANVMV